jgi:Tripartite tricarboxylate transporter family receptor
MMAGVDLVHVPYRGGGPVMTDLLGGQVQVLFGTTSLTVEPALAATFATTPHRQIRQFHIKKLCRASNNSIKVASAKVAPRFERQGHTERRTCCPI